MSKKINSAMTISVETIDPKAAKRDFENRAKNRAIRNPTVNYYLQQMRANNWHLTPEGIAYNTKNQLIDGQHRLKALSKYEKPLKFVVFRNVDPETFQYLNQGRTRSLADLFNIAGFQKASILTPAVRLIIVIRDKGIWRLKSKIAPVEAFEFVEKNPDVIKKILEMYKMIKASGYSKLFPQHIASAFYYMCGEKSWKFWHQFYSGLNLEPDTPVNAFRVRMFQNMINHDQEIKHDIKIRLAFKAWDYYRKNKKLRSLDLQKGEYLRLDF